MVKSLETMQDLSG